ncbi:zinc-dependent metalloprotease [Fundidesulfovibrio terrae]|uniref:zinc-dependent metalloprotease n=1 Tax=Fundidesulfovibrio terrae TaxID=2922866 RepID=UPI001FB011CD|nr:zinc-dependent metalloprotease [Fundidesulfovibrio terrae]
MTPDGAKDAIKEANKAHKQANMQLVVVKVQNATEGDAGNDGEFNKDERKAVRTFGGKELEKLPNQKGLKICFGKTPTTESPTNPGISVHKDPTLIVKNRATAAETGQTIAHEIGHVMTLGAGHTVTSTQKANAGGHTPNTPGETGKENLMAPSNYRTDTKLTADQIAEMQTRKYFVGKCSTQFNSAFPAVKDKQQFGANTDAGNDQGGAPAIFDLHQMFLASLESSGVIQSQISVQTPLPGSAIGATYTLGFDSDQNAATGVAYSGLPGVDRVVKISASGVFGTPGFSLTGSVIDAVTLTVVSPLSSLQAVIADSLVDID